MGIFRNIINGSILFLGMMGALESGACTLLSDKSVAQKSYHVGINQIVEHPALNRTVLGIREGLRRRGFVDGQNLTFTIDSAQGNPGLAVQISNKFLSQFEKGKLDVAVGVGTVSALTLSKHAAKRHLPVVFSSITFPEKSGIVPCVKHPGAFITGVSNYVSIDAQLAIFRRIQPNLKRLGILYNVGEINSVQLVDVLARACKKIGITLVPQSVTRTADVPQNATKLVQDCDAVFISNDNTALSSLKSIVKVATKKGIPVYVSDTDAVVQGAVAALGPNQYEIGIQTGEKIAQILNHGPGTEIPVSFPKNVELVLNEAAAKKIGMTFPNDLKQQAAQSLSDPQKENNS